MPSETPQATDAATRADIGIVHATSIELGAFLERCEKVKQYKGNGLVFRGGRYKHIRVACVQSGMGSALAARGTRALLDGHSPVWVISAGFSGALKSEMRVGDIVMADSIIDQSNNTLSLDMKMPADPAKGLYVGKLYMSETLVRTVQEKQELADRTGAIAVDMESMTVAQICHDAKVRFVAVRVISDDMSHDLPEEIMTIVGSSGAVRIGAALGALWKRPSSATDMWRLRGQAQESASRLATFLEGVVTQLHAATTK